MVQIPRHQERNMQFRTAELKSAVASLLPMIPARTPCELMKWIEIAPTFVRVYSGNIVTAATRLNGEGTGRLMLDGRILAQILPKITQQTISLVANENGNVVLKSEGATFTLATINDEFPKPPETEFTAVKMINGKLLKSALKVASIATGVDERYGYGSVGLQWPYLFSSDSTSVSMVRMEDCEPMTQRLIPADTVSQICSALPDDEDVAIYDSPGMVKFRSDTVLIVARLSEGRLPSVWTILKSIEGKSIIDIDPKELRNAIDLASITINPESERMIFRFEDGKTIIRTQGADKGESEISLTSSLDGDPVEVILYGKQVRKFVSRSDQNQPLTIKLDGPDSIVSVTQDKVTFLLSPIRITE